MCCVKMIRKPFIIHLKNAVQVRNLFKTNRPDPPQNWPLQILVCCFLPLRGLHFSPMARLFVTILLDLTSVPAPHELEHPDHFPYPDQVSHILLSLSSIDGGCSNIRMQIFLRFCECVIFCKYGKCGCICILRM